MGGFFDFKHEKRSWCWWASFFFYGIGFNIFLKVVFVKYDVLRNKADWAGTMWADFELLQSAQNLKARPYSKQ